MALDIFAVEPHGTDPSRSSKPARTELNGGFTTLLLSSLATRGLAGSMLTPGLEIARNLGTGLGPDAAREPKAQTRFAPEADADTPASEKTAREDAPDDIDDADNDAAPREDSVPAQKDTADAGAVNETDEPADADETAVADGAHMPAMLTGTPRGGGAEAGSLASLLSQVGANEAAISAVAGVAPATGAAPAHAATNATSATIVQQAQSGVRAATVLETAQSVQMAQRNVAGGNTGPAMANTTVTQTAPGLMSRPNAALAPGAALAAVATDTSERGSVISAATPAAGPATQMPHAGTQRAAHMPTPIPTQNTMPATANGTPAAANLSPANTTPAASIDGGVWPMAGAGSETASLRAGRPDLAPTSIQQGATKGQAQAQSTPGGATGARADAIIAPAALTAPTPTQPATAASRPAPIAQTALPLSASEAGTGTNNGGSGASFNPLFQRAGAQAAAATKPLIQRPLPANTTATDQIAINIQRAATAGADRIQIRMVPAELGRVDVRLEMSRGQRIKAVIMAEKQDTLDLLIRDVRQLERALQQAGLQVEHDSLEFSLRHGNNDAAMAQNDGAGAGDDADAAGEESDVAGDMKLADAAHAEIITDDHIDVHV